MPSVNFGFRFTPPPGLTDIRQLPHKWQQATMERMQAEAGKQAENALANIKGEWLAAYPEGWGTVPRSLKYTMKTSRQGVNISFRAAGRELQWITALGGGLFEAGATFEIENNEGGFLSFFWKRKRRWARFQKVTHPGWDVDVLSEMFQLQGEEFQLAMGDAYNRGATELLQSFGTPKPVGSKTRRDF